MFFSLWKVLDKFNILPFSQNVLKNIDTNSILKFDSKSELKINLKESILIPLYLPHTGEDNN